MIYITAEQFLSAVRRVYLTAKAGNYRYGDSKKMPPTSDGVISCDRLIAKACWDLGWTEQPIKGATCGITVENMEQYLLKWGWKKITKKSDLQRGDVILMNHIGQKTADASWHTYVLVSYDPATDTVSKYDEGDTWRITATQPFIKKAFNEWTTPGEVPVVRTFYCGFRCPQLPKKNEKYTRSFRAVYNGQKGSHVRFLQKLLRYANCKGKDGKVLTVDGECGENTVYAIKTYQIRKKKQGIDLGTDGICGAKMWKTMIG